MAYSDPPAIVAGPGVVGAGSNSASSIVRTGPW
jgi:hypothetical protein